jgi:hypothetical protein
MTAKFLPWMTAPAIGHHRFWPNLHPRFASSEKPMAARPPRLTTVFRNAGARLLLFSTATIGGQRTNCPRLSAHFPLTLPLDSWVIASPKFWPTVPGAASWSVKPHTFGLIPWMAPGSFACGRVFLAPAAWLLRRIGPVPEALVIEADEFLFTLGAFFSEVLLLREPLTFYRLHGQNLYQVSDRNLSSLQRKHAVLLALADALRRRFAEEHVSSEICHVIVDAVQTEADLVRLSLGDGSPLDTFRTELRSYDLSREHASPLRWFLKCITLVPALFLPPRRYNALKQKLVSSPFYAKAREKFYPFHGPNHVDRTGDWNLR